MSKIFKINTTIIICIAFLFRLLFVNISIIASLNTKQSNGFVKSCLSSVMKKRRRGNDVVVNAYLNEYSVIEICEENLNDEDDFSKTNPFILISYVYSVITNKCKDLNPNALFDFLNYKLSSKKYLAISVLRI